MGPLLPVLRARSRRSSSGQATSWPRCRPASRAVPFRPNEGPFWPVGEVTSDGGPIEITVGAEEVSGLQKLLGVDSPAVIGNIAATRLADTQARTFAASCGLYLDHYYLGVPGALQASRESGGGEPTSTRPAERRAASL